MQPRAEEIQRLLAKFAQPEPGRQESAARLRGFALVVQGSVPLEARIRDLRGSCAMIDIGSSIFTLAYSDILGIDPIPAGEGGLRVTVRPGCFASHVAARLRRSSVRPWSSAGQGRTAEPAPVASSGAGPLHPAVWPEGSGVVREGGVAKSDPAETESARHEIVGNDALRDSRR